jgi:hypothetical protein
MSDIFISYASADRERATLLSKALQRRGRSVWWDRTIPPGKEYDQVIEEALDSAQCVVVLWSHASVASSWVKTEAAEAMRRKILVPALGVGREEVVLRLPDETHLAILSQIEQRTGVTVVRHVE